MAQGAAFKEVATSKLRRLLAYTKSSKCADVGIGDSALFSRQEAARTRRVGVARR